MSVPGQADSDDAQLLKGQSLGDQKPSHLLNHMSQLNGGQCSSAVLKSLFFEQLPESQRAILVAMNEPDLQKIADIADKIADMSSLDTAIALIRSHPDTNKTCLHKDTNDPSNTEKQLAEIIKRLDSLDTAVPFSIIGADLLKHYGLDVSLSRRYLFDSTTKLYTTGSISTVPDLCLSTVDHSNNFAKILTKFQEITGVLQQTTQKTSDVEHHILTNGPPTAERPRRLAPDKLKAAKAEFKRLMKLGICRPSSSPWASPIHLWCEEISTLKNQCHKARRVLTRKKRNGSDEEIALAKQKYANIQKDLRIAIRRAKSNAWKDLQATIDNDPWERPFRIVTRKMRPQDMPVVSTLSSTALEEILAVLFPRGVKGREYSREQIPWCSDWDVQESKIKAALKKIQGNKAPGPRRILGSVMTGTSMFLLSDWARCFTLCLKEGSFLENWKVANLVLIRKKEGKVNDPACFRPICLLDEAGKLLERVIVERIHTHLNDTDGLSNEQYGFRQGRSTIDAIRRLRSYVQDQRSQGRMVMAVGLDIANAFNSLPWSTILKAMRRKQFPDYLLRIVRDYLNNRWITYIDRSDEKVKREITRGVPQGSVLGPTLWNIGYDKVLTSVMLPKACMVICYADDTVLLTPGNNIRELVNNTEMAAASLILEIEKLGLRVASTKTEVMVFPSSAIQNQSILVLIKGEPVKINSSMKYLGIVLDGNWTTVSFVAAIILARGVPLELTAQTLTHVYNQMRNMSREGDLLEHSAKVRLCLQAKREAIKEWKKRVTTSHNTSGTRVTQATITHLEEWYRMIIGYTTFHITQMMSGHGCFKEYLFKIKRATSPSCEHCSNGIDTAQHTLELCPAWDQDRNKLREVLGRGVRLGLPSIIEETIKNVEK
nr:PREDICTED: uncharacterized protein LOC105672376 [Linepithema humile]